MKEKYKGFNIIECQDGTFDIEELNGDLVDGNFKSLQDCKDDIDLYEPHPSRDRA